MRSTSGRYASYWNAFLFVFKSLQLWTFLWQLQLINLLRSCGKVMFSQACVKNLCPWGKCTSHLGRHPLGRQPPTRYPPLEDIPPSRWLLQVMVCILLECIPVHISVESLPSYTSLDSAGIYSQYSIFIKGSVRDVEFPVIIHQTLHGNSLVTS